MYTTAQAVGASKGTRTPGQLLRRQLLYPLSYTGLEPTVGLEPTTDCLQNSCATIAPRWPGRVAQIRTENHLLPKQGLYHSATTLYAEWIPLCFSGISIS